MKKVYKNSTILANAKLHILLQQPCTDTANEKCILYATPGELSQSNLYRLESNPAYRGKHHTCIAYMHALITIAKFLIEPAGVSHYELDKPLECDDSVIPRHLNPCYQYTEGIKNVMKKQF